MVAIKGCFVFRFVFFFWFFFYSFSNSYFVIGMSCLAYNYNIMIPQYCVIVHILEDVIIALYVTLYFFLMVCYKIINIFIVNI